MNRVIWIDFIRIIALVLLQELIFNEMYIFGFINPQIYLLFVFLIPFSKDNIKPLLLSFILGILIDLLNNEGGVHTFSIVLVTYLRLLYLEIIKGDNLTDGDISSFKDLNNGLLLTWVIAITLTHHLVMFSLETFSIYQTGRILLNTLATGSVSILVIMFVISLFSKQKQHA